jgi:nitroreductase
MEFSEVLRRRRMVRRFLPDPVDGQVLTAIVDAARRGPSAGFSQGVDVVVLRAAADRERFWAAATPAGRPRKGWLERMTIAPVLLVFCADPERYLARYGAADKATTARAVGRPGPDPRQWPVPWWDVDTGMAALLALLAATNAGLGACLFGVPAQSADAVASALRAPEGRRVVGVVAVGTPARETGARARARRPAREHVHEGRFGVPFPAGSGDAPTRQ